jgi:hypothetical protein
MKYSRGTNPNSRKKRVYYINDDYFKTTNLENCYYAGWIAADGNITNKNYLNIGISLKDKEIFDKFLESTNSNYRICEYLSKNKFPTVSLSIKSDTFSLTAGTSYEFRYYIGNGPLVLSTDNTAEVFFNLVQYC